MDISEAVLDFFNSRKLLKQLNYTTSSLVPKTEQPGDVTQYKQIACYNVLYKVIFKIMCKHLKLVLPVVVHQVQSAFCLKSCYFA